MQLIILRVILTLEGFYYIRSILSRSIDRFLLLNSTKELAHFQLQSTLNPKPITFLTPSEYIHLLNIFQSTFTTARLQPQ